MSDTSSSPLETWSEPIAYSNTVSFEAGFGRAGAAKVIHAPAETEAGSDPHALGGIIVHERGVPSVGVDSLDAVSLLGCK